MTMFRRQSNFYTPLIFVEQFFLLCFVPILTNLHALRTGFVVHRGRTIPTLASMQEPLPAVRSKQSKERSSIDLKGEERGNFFLFYFEILHELHR